MSYLEYMLIKDDRVRAQIITSAYQLEDVGLLDSNDSSIISKNTPVDSFVHKCSRSTYE